MVGGGQREIQEVAHSPSTVITLSLLWQWEVQLSFEPMLEA